ncbi:imidazolonepropionase-like amidohydrolase [Saccharopolyspora erythraea NRRL 2338]|uniref:Xaa-Pro dipeptidase family enzyme n=2 Tax=Saccharopolyspora erythraea TaxID=1836 RepID=A4FJI7_SACEN|nr:amidohydrolase family protein [Saccharopolyspora erythraea]EQD81614.1 amidohydrolase [Saccharopolyspora erythraea D]PFG97871.1 imidazolonepropionase-like amidohydrolase [Saccharopolyspora erythraea NRRL 2338]QRK88005.1 amidohydrolase family protein [Saccharopolyspora erythraea]CAM04212.1 Xaa-Pro dipeptidase family enzyme [Saccharopolyspora erythraea NRRL 2338]
MPQEPEALASNEARGPATYDLVIRRAHIFDGYQALAGLYDVAINGGEIASVSVEPLRGIQEVDAAEGWVMPGLIDTHIHFYDVRAVSGPNSMRAFEENELSGKLGLFLDHGITTIKSVGDPTDGILDTRAKIGAGTLRGPRLLATGCGITGRDGHPAATVFSGNPWARERFTGEVDSVQQIRDLVHHLADRKVDAIKLLSEGACAHGPKYLWQNPAFPDGVELERLPLDLLRAGIETGHERGLRVTVHTTQQAAAREAIEAGADGLEHGVTVEPLTDHSLIDLMLEHGVTYAPTLWIDDAHPDARGNLKKVAEVGVHIALGSDTFSGRGLFGANTLEEAELMVAAGMTPTQVLAAGTRGASRQCVRPDLGTVAPGKRADLLVLNADPTADIGNLRDLSMVILNGRLAVDKR